MTQIASLYAAPFMPNEPPMSSLTTRIFSGATPKIAFASVAR